MQTTKTLLEWVNPKTKFNEEFFRNEWISINSKLYFKFGYILKFEDYFTVADIFYGNKELVGKVKEVYHTKIIQEGIVYWFIDKTFNMSLHNYIEHISMHYKK